VIVENVHKFSLKLFGNFVRVTACISWWPATFPEKLTVLHLVKKCPDFMEPKILGSHKITGVLIGERTINDILSLLSRKFIHKYKIR